MDMCKIFVLQYNSKTTAASGNIFHGNGSLTQVQDLFYEAETTDISILFMGTVALVKFVKDMFHGIFTDLGAFVFYGKTDLFSFRHHPDIDRTTTGTEFDSIGKQIVPYMTDEIFVSKILHIHHVHIKWIVGSAHPDGTSSDGSGLTGVRSWTATGYFLPGGKAFWC